ncbi:MAG: hypothetical protein JSS12_11215 [Verrucomicrobia bacterium]|nr:hypothetical protein [Verrucomicrobiota bacterium]
MFLPKICSLVLVAGLLLCFSVDAAPPVAQYSFSVIPRVIKVGSGSPQITIACVLSPGQEIVATHKSGKTRFSYSPALKSFLKKQNLSVSSLKPLKSYMQAEIKNAKKDPASYVSALDAYLRLGLAESYTVQISK